jgi:nitric oxide reductase subunit B
MRYNKRWVCFAIVIVVSFAVLGYYGGEIYRQAPPVPDFPSTHVSGIMPH